MSNTERIRIGQMADLHLGFRQYGLMKRAEDFWNAATKAAKKLIDADVQMVVIPGDIYNDKRPYPIAQRHAIRFLDLFQKSGIPIFVTRGNHDASYAWRELQGGDSLDLLQELEYVTYIRDAVIEPEDLNIRIWGLGYYGKATSSKLAELIESNADFLKDESKPNILLLHAFLDSQVPGEDLTEYELGIHDFDYVAIGHYHRWWISGSGKIVCSGSTEHTMSSDWDEKQRSVAVVELSKTSKKWKTEVERLKFNVRPKIDRSLDLGEIDADDATLAAIEALREIDAEDALIRLELNGKLKDVVKSVDSREIASCATKALHVRIVDELEFGGVPVKFDSSEDEIMAEVLTKKFNVPEDDANQWVALALEVKDALMGGGSDSVHVVEDLLEEYSKRIQSIPTNESKQRKSSSKKRRRAK